MNPRRVNKIYSFRSQNSKINKMDFANREYLNRWIKELEVPVMYKKHFAILLVKSMFNVTNYLDNNQLLNNFTIVADDIKMFKTMYNSANNDNNIYPDIAKICSKELHMITRVNVLKMIRDTIIKIMGLFNIDPYQSPIPDKVAIELGKYSDVNDMRLIESDLMHRVNMKIGNTGTTMIFPYQISETTYHVIESDINFLNYYYRKFFNDFPTMINEYANDETFTIALRVAKCFYYSFLLTHLDELYNEPLSNNVNNLLNNGSESIGKILNSKMMSSKKMFKTLDKYGYISPFNILNSYKDLKKIFMVTNENNLILTDDLKNLLYSVIILSNF